MGRYHRGYNRGYRRNQLSLFGILIIILLAVATGYVGAKYVIYPYLLDGQAPNKTTTEESTKNKTADNPITSLPGVIVDKQEIKEEKNNKDSSTDQTTNKDASKDTKDTNAQVKDTGSNTATTTTPSGVNTKGAYSLQFGNFTVKEGAEKRVKELINLGISAYVFETNGGYRVLGNTYDNKERAKEAAQIVLPSAGDVFVIDMKTLI